MFAEQIFGYDLREHPPWWLELGRQYFIYAWRERGPWLFFKYTDEFDEHDLAFVNNLRYNHIAYYYLWDV